ncbi:hypothetical protein C8R44DRAFT_883486 [Mycena epipterygia]|nr:hypothetical protein C8R44DRAFT_883486 [Mycena epipterygia]
MLIGQAASICSFTQESLLPSFLGRMLALSVAEPDFSPQLSKYFRKYAPIAPLSIVQQSSTSMYAALPKTLKLKLLSWKPDEEQAPARLALHMQIPRLELDTLPIHIPADPEFLTWLGSEDSASLAGSPELQWTWITTGTESNIITDTVYNIFVG